MLAFLILPVLTCGFFICNHSPPHFYKLHRYEGQQLYLKSAYLGIKCLFWAGLIVLLLNYYVPPTVLGLPVDAYNYLLRLISPLTNDPKIATQLTWLILIAVAMHGWAIISVYVSKLRGLIFTKLTKVDYKIRLMMSILTDSPLDKQLLVSYIIENTVMISLSNRKVYVGRVISLGEPNESEGLDQEVDFLPQMSGYRDKDSLTVTFTTFYETIKTGAKMTVTIRQELIESVSDFDFDVYKQFLLDRNQKTLPKFKDRTI